MPANLEFMGTQLTIRFDIENTATIKEVKEMIKTLYGVPVARQTLRWGPATLADDRTLASYNIGEEQMVLMDLVVEANETDPIIVTLEAPRFPTWSETVLCMENITVGQLKRLVADKLRWNSTGAMNLHYGPAMTSMNDEDRLISEYLVVNGSVVYVRFLNGSKPPKKPMVRAMPAARF